MLIHVFALCVYRAHTHTRVSACARMSFSGINAGKRVHIFPFVFTVERTCVGEGEGGGGEDFMSLLRVAVRVYYTAAASPENEADFRHGYVSKSKAVFSINAHYRALLFCSVHFSAPRTSSLATASAACVLVFYSKDHPKIRIVNTNARSLWSLRGLPEFAIYAPSMRIMSPVTFHEEMSREIRERILRRVISMTNWDWMYYDARFRRRSMMNNNDERTRCLIVIDIELIKEYFDLWL